MLRRHSIASVEDHGFKTNIAAVHWQQGHLRTDRVHCNACAPSALPTVSKASTSAANPPPPLFKTARRSCTRPSIKEISESWRINLHTTCVHDVRLTRCQMTRRQKTRVASHCESDQFRRDAAASHRASARNHSLSHGNLSRHLPRTLPRPKEERKMERKEKKKKEKGERALQPRRTCSQPGTLMRFGDDALRIAQQTHVPQTAPLRLLTGSLLSSQLRSVRLGRLDRGSGRAPPAH